MLTLARIATTIDTAKTSAKKVTMVGAAPLLACDLTRSGVAHFDFVDFDIVQPPNIPRQGFSSDQAGTLKIHAVRKMVRSINSDAQVNCFPCDFTAMTDEEMNRHFADTDLFIFATDSFAAQARGNELALRLGKDALWLGLYPRG